MQASFNAKVGILTLRSRQYKDDLGAFNVTLDLRFNKGHTDWPQLRSAISKRGVKLSGSFADDGDWRMKLDVPTFGQVDITSVGPWPEHCLVDFACRFDLATWLVSLDDVDLLDQLLEQRLEDRLESRANKPAWATGSASGQVVRKCLLGTMRSSLNFVQKQLGPKQKTLQLPGFFNKAKLGSFHPYPFVAPSTSLFWTLARLYSKFLPSSRSLAFPRATSRSFCASLPTYRLRKICPILHITRCQRS